MAMVLQGSRKVNSSRPSISRSVVVVIVVVVVAVARQDKTRQDNGEKRMQAVVPLYPYPCYTLN